MKKILILFSLSVSLCLFGLFLASCEKPSKIDRTQIPIHISPRRPRIAYIQDVFIFKLQEHYQTVEQPFIEIISFNLGVPHEEISRKTDLADDLNVDELQVLEIIMDLEDHFSLWLPKEARDSITQVGNGIEYLRDQIKRRIQEAMQFHNELLSLAQSGQAFSPERGRNVMKYGGLGIGRFLNLGIWINDAGTTTLAEISTAFYNSPNFWPILVWTNLPNQIESRNRPDFAYLSEESTPETRIETGKKLWIIYLLGH